MATWVTDLRHVPGEDADDVPTAARDRARFTRDVVAASTSRLVEGRWPTAVQCVARVGPKTCGGCVAVWHVGGRDEIEWVCAACGANGVITGFTGSESDLSRYRPRGKGKLRLWGYEDEERDVLWEATRAIPELRAVIARATPHDEYPGVFVLHATVAELDDVYTLVEELTDRTRSRRRRDLLDGLRATLCTAMDGF